MPKFKQGETVFVKEEGIGGVCRKLLGLRGTVEGLSSPMGKPKTAPISISTEMELEPVYVVHPEGAAPGKFLQIPESCLSLAE